MLVDIDQQCGKIEIPFRECLAHRAASAGQDPGSALDRILHLLFHFVALRCGVQRADDDTLFDTIPDSKPVHFGNELRDKLIVDLVEQIEPLDGEARLAAIEESSDGCRADGFIDVGIVANNHRIASAELERHALHVLRGHFHHVLARGCGAGETDFAHSRIL